MCSKYIDDLSAQEVGDQYASMRHGGVSMRQVRAAIFKVCGRDYGGRAKKSQISDIFLELDRRYFIVENARWEFSMLDRSRQGEISEQKAMFLFKAVQGDLYTGSWTMFRNKRPDPGSKVKWEELEVPLCDILLEGEDYHLDTRDGDVMGENSVVQNGQSQIEGKQASESAEEKIAKATQREEEAKREAEEAEEKLRSADSEESKRAAEEAKRQALERAQNEKHIILKQRLQRAVTLEEISELEPAVAAVKKEEVPGCSELVSKAEDLIKKLRASYKLKDAVVSRKIAELEGAIDGVKKGRWEKDLQRSVVEANALLEKLRRLEQRKRAVLELSQRVIAELKSYSQPPQLVQHVMSATFLLLGTPEKETKSWQATQILIGKTGKTSLKRRVSECSVEKISVAVAQRVTAILSQYEFIAVQDTSLGCATFYSWAEGMVEEVLSTT